MYAGAANASTALAGEFIGILSAENPAEIKSGLEAAILYLENEAFFRTANDDGSIVYFAQCISRTGSYLSKEAGVPEGTAMARKLAPNEPVHVRKDAIITPAAQDALRERGICAVRDE